MSGWLKLRCIAASCVSEDLQQPLKVPLQRMFERGCEGSFDYDAFIRSQSLLLIGGRWIIHWRKKGKKKIKRFEMVNSTQQWPTEEIYITNCLCTDCRPSVCVCFYALRLIQWPHRQGTLYAARIVPHGFKFRVLANTGRDCCCGGWSPLPFYPPPLSFAHTDSLACLPPILFARIKLILNSFNERISDSRKFQKATSLVRPYMVATDVILLA